MTEIEKISNQVLSKTSIHKEQKFGSILAIIMIIGIIVNVVRVVQECEKDKSKNIEQCNQTSFFKNVFRTLAKRRKWYTSMRLRKIIRQTLPPADYKVYKTEIHDAILEVGEALSDEQTAALMEAANND